jgi:septum formation inhibitor-activating ATPase MinD
MITSFKGGVGKSTVAVNLAVGLAVRKYRVMIIDLDASSGSVDLFMGCENDTIYNFCDVAEKRVNIQDAVYVKKAEMRTNTGKENKDNPNSVYYSLDVLRAPPSYDISVSLEKAIGEFIEEAKEIYDYIIFDCPSGKFPLFEILSQKIDTVFVVTLHTAASIRSAENLALSLSEQGSKGENVRLIINCFNSRGVIRGLNLGIVDIIERSKIKLIGLIGINYHIRDCQELGKTAYDLKNMRIKKYFDDIIGRILDNNISLESKYDGIKTNALYFKKGAKNDD